MAAVTAVTPAAAQKKGYTLSSKLSNPSGKSQKAEESAMAKGSFMVASQCEDCNNGYRLEQIIFSGYDKPQQSGVETFFITNTTDRTLTGVNMYLDYRMADGRQLHRRFVRLSCLIPPGETRIAEVPTWDKQKSFYYEKSTASKKGGTPYQVALDPVAIYLRF